MELNGVNSVAVAQSSGAVASKYSSKAEKNGSSTAEKAIYSDVAATYESSQNSNTGNLRKVANPELVAQMKADLQNRQAQMQSLVTDMFKKQGITIGNASEMWKHLASGNFTVDEETIKKAKEDISEDGYWGVKKTSERIISFAQALAGDDEEAMKKMQKAVEKGFKLATKEWGKDLPSISKDTLDAVNKKFDDYFNSKKETIQ